MKNRTALFGAAVLLAGAGVAHANVAVRSKVTITFVISATVDQAGADSDTKIQRVRFNTKDFLAVLADSNGQTDLKSVVFSRTTDTADDTPPTAVLDAQLAILDRSGAVVPAALTGFTINAPFDFNVELGTTLLDRTVSQIADATAGGTDVQSRRDITSEGATWSLDGAADDFVLDMLSLNTVTSRRRAIAGTDQGLFITSRTATVHGGVDAAFTVGTGDLVDFTGVLSGTVKASAEKP